MPPKDFVQMERFENAGTTFVVFKREREIIVVNAAKHPDVLFAAPDDFDLWERYSTS